MKTIGIIGTGIMGRPMAENLMKAGFAIRVFARHKEKAEKLKEQGAALCDSIPKCTEGCDAVVTMLGFPADVEEVYLGEDGILNHVSAGAYVIDMTTSSPELAKKIYAVGKEKNIYVLDAPVTGGEKGAVNGTLSIMVGGDMEAYNACADLFAVLGERVAFMGGPGAGQHTKLSNQIMIAGAIVGACEGMSYAMGQGLDMETWFRLVSHGGAASRQLENIFPRIQNGDDGPGFQIRHFIKDMKLAASQSRSMGMDFSVLEQVIKNYESLQDEGFGEKGTQALIHLYLNQIL